MEDARIAAGLDPRTRDGFAVPARLAKCGWAKSGIVTVRGIPGDGRAHFGGLIQCGSVWACPCCSSVIRAGRSTEIQTAAKLWERQAGAFLFVTFTLRHKTEDALADSLDLLGQSFTRVIRGNPWKRFASRLGVVGQIKATEVTWSRRNGWHAHLHVLFFLRDKPSATAVESADSWLSARWQTLVVRHGGRVPTIKHGVDVRRVTNGQIVAAYVSKIQEKKRYKVADELTRIDMKKGRLDSLVPFDFLDLDGLSAEQVAQRRALWGEYVSGTKGRHALQWSRVLRDLFDVPDTTDEDLLEAEEDGVEDLWAVRRRDWRRIQSSPDALVGLLEAVERSRWDLAESIAPCATDWLRMADAARRRAA